MARTIVHPRLLDALPQFYPSKATIQEAQEVLSGSGSRTITWTSLPGHSNIDATVAPIYIQSPLDREVRQAELTIAADTYHVGLRGYFPGIRSSMRALIDGRGYDIETVDFDSHKTTTRLRTREVEI